MSDAEFEPDLRFKRDTDEEGRYPRSWHANSLLALTFEIPRIPCDFSIGKYEPMNLYLLFFDVQATTKCDASIPLNGHSSIDKQIIPK